VLWADPFGLVYGSRLLTHRPTATVDDGIAWLRALVVDLQTPALQAYGLKPAHVSELVKKAAKASSMKANQANPIPLTDSELSAILERAL
jgi:alcohol dehydrogenase class IV